MSVPIEFAKAFAVFPPVLRELVQAELAAGNSIVAIEHGFPAAPCGASIKLAQAVATERRKPVGELKFYTRNNSSYAGEFTTDLRHFFVLEPPLPHEPAPDMDAIRQSLEPKSDSSAQLAQRRAGGAPALPPVIASASPAAPPSFTNIETATGWTRVLLFEDKRAPHEVQFALEREVRMLFTPAMADGKLRLRAKATVIGALYQFELRFEAALASTNRYSLRVETSWADQEATNHDYYRKTSDSRFAMWTRDLMAATPPETDAGSPERYRKLADDALKAEAHLDTVAAIQQAVIAELKRGGSFGTSHKEGGTNIYWRIDRFMRSDYGDDPGHESFTDEAKFLKMLRQFLEWEITNHAAPGSLTERDTWKLILRRLRKP